MKIYDSLTQKELEVNEENINIYNCGPTVYNDVHIGNIRPLITFDILCRYLRLVGKKVEYAHNFTDIDDKIINRAIEENLSEKEIADKYIVAYSLVMESLNVVKPDYLPKVSDNIEGIVDFVDQLVKKNKAYVGKDSVYFDISCVKDAYGELSKQNIEQLLDGSRKENDLEKKSPLDFALWKNTDVGIKWPSPWFEGRPGWHTECVYFINKIFGKQVTIHGGGIDLKFPHHENENAQNIALNNEELAKIWMHVGHINVNGQKMSKSLGNFILAKDLIASYGANAIRWFFLQTKYENPINFTKEMLTNAQNDIEKIQKAINMALIQMEGELVSEEKISSEFINAFDNDLNFPEAVTLIWKQVKLLTNLIRNKKWNEVNENINYLFTEFKCLGIEIKKEFDEKTKQIINEWKNALGQKNYMEADKYRKELEDNKTI